MGQAGWLKVLLSQLEDYPPEASLEVGDLQSGIKFERMWVEKGIKLYVYQCQYHTLS